ncbi:dienelactone hydrolase family protein [Rhizomonospora bruguierae]|uniref:dienelactone hydrolase family protein n=1 Tax=Rhizomonospora bruguierae TaxID=1581705 RepID=UPI001BCC1B94|nr:hydrolase [Micromonospora sp. NBRC 107566]
MTELLIPAGRVRLAGDVTAPAGAAGTVLFAHGSGSSRLSPRNQFVAAALRQRNLATVLVDLLTDEEERVDVVTAELRFDVELLAARLIDILDWLGTGAAGAGGGGPVGLFGASTGAAAALLAAAGRPDAVRAVVSRGGRPDLAGGALPAVTAPTLLLVGGLDTQVLELNERAAAVLGGPVEVRVVPGAGHLFEESGALEAVAADAGSWFIEHLR